MGVSRCVAAHVMAGVRSGISAVCLILAISRSMVSRFRVKVTGLLARARHVMYSGNPGTARIRPRVMCMVVYVRWPTRSRLKVVVVCSCVHIMSISGWSSINAARHVKVIVSRWGTVRFVMAARTLLVICIPP